MTLHRGWTYGMVSNAPITGRWHASRHGVGMCNSTEEGLRRMIDARTYEEQRGRDLRQKMEGLTDRELIALLPKSRHEVMAGSWQEQEALRREIGGRGLWKTIGGMR
jgi:hypothetical protein